MTVAALAGQSDPFTTVLDSLSTASQTVGDLSSPITDVQNIVTVVDNVLDDLDEVPTLLSGISELLEALEGILAILDAVPIVDAVAGVCTEVVTTAQELVNGADEAFTEVDESLIKPCKTAFDDLNKGLTQAHDVVHTIGVTVPDYLNTLQILHFMAEIAAPLTEVLKGSQPADDLAALLKTLNGVEQAVGQALLPLSSFLDDLNQVVHAIGQALHSVFSDLKDTMQTVETGLHWVDEAFSPIVRAFNSVADAIKPIRWALDAISWIFNEVCKPIINAILEATGLDKLLDGLEQEVEAKLGIKPILDLVQANLDSQAAGNWQQQGGAKAAGTGQDAWGTVSDVLKQYNTRDNDHFKTDINLLISALAGAPIDPDKPGLIPDWPEQPKLPVSAPAPNAATMRADGGVFIQAIPLQPIMRGQRLARSFQSLAAIPNQVATPSRLPVGRLLAETVPSQGVPSLETLKSLATQAQTDLAEAAKIGPDLAADLKSYDAARTLPHDFHLSMQDLAELLSDSSQMLDFLAQFDFLTHLIDDLKAPLASQADAMADILKATDGLTQAGDAMDGVVKQVIASVPSADVFTAALDYLDSVAMGAASLSSAMSEARQLDAGLNNAHQAQLDDLHHQLDASAAAVITQTQQVEKLAGQSLAAAKQVRATLEAYAAALGQLSADADVIASDALPNLTKGVHLLNTLTSILDPLSGLLQSLNCVDGGDPVKQGAADTVNGFKSSAAAAINGQDEALRTLFNVVLAQAIHSDRLTADITAVNTLVQHSQADFDRAQKDLSAVLAALPAAMQPTHQFPTTNKAGQSISVDNLFIDQAFAAQAQAVFDAIQKAAQAAGHINGNA